MGFLRSGMSRTIVIAAILVVAGSFGARANDVRAPDFNAPVKASDADNACASIAAYSQTHAEAAILPFIKSCGGNPHKAVCEQTIIMMKAADSPNERTYGLVCTGSS